ncbi:MAG: 50S ribosomal protein L6 [Lentisphaerae bacterium]|jgi:large subunit ribosomal protein L6|nr:50S ribosomal protein L6 [Lentisphaerota bacterium]
MSRIGKMPLTIPDGVTVTANGGEVVVKGKLGELSRTLPNGITVVVEGNELKVSRRDDSRFQKGFHGLSRTLIKNMVEGVSAGYRKELSIEGTGFRSQVQGDKLMLWLGFASAKEFNIPQGITITEKQGTRVTIEGIDKELVGETAVHIRSYYPAEPYKGKGIKYVGEQIRRKQGKTVA